MQRLHRVDHHLVGGGCGGDRGERRRAVRVAGGHDLGYRATATGRRDAELPARRLRLAFALLAQGQLDVVARHEIGQHIAAPLGHEGLFGLNADQQLQLPGPRAQAGAAIFDAHRCLLPRLVDVGRRRISVQCGLVAVPAGCGDHPALVVGGQHARQWRAQHQLAGHRHLALHRHVAADRQAVGAENAGHVQARKARAGAGSDVLHGVQANVGRSADLVHEDVGRGARRLGQGRAGQIAQHEARRCAAQRRGADQQLPQRRRSRLAGAAVAGRNWLAHRRAVIVGASISWRTAWPLDGGAQHGFVAAAAIGRVGHDVDPADRLRVGAEVGQQVLRVIQRRVALAEQVVRFAWSILAAVAQQPFLQQAQVQQLRAAQQARARQLSDRRHAGHRQHVNSGQQQAALGPGLGRGHGAVVGHHLGAQPSHPDLERGVQVGRVSGARNHQLDRRHPQAAGLGQGRRGGQRGRDTGGPAGRYRGAQAGFDIELELLHRHGTGQHLAHLDAAQPGHHRAHRVVLGQAGGDPGKIEAEAVADAGIRHQRAFVPAGFTGNGHRRAADLGITQHHIDRGPGGRRAVHGDLRSPPGAEVGALLGGYAHQMPVGQQGQARGHADLVTVGCHQRRTGSDRQAAEHAVANGLAQRPLVAGGQVGMLLTEVVHAQHHAEAEVDALARVERGARRGAEVGTCAAAHACLLKSISTVQADAVGRGLRAGAGELRAAQVVLAQHHRRPE